jgi:hypothetical protein
MPDKSSEVDQAFTEDFEGFDFDRRFAGSGDASEAAPDAPDQAASDHGAPSDDASAADAQEASDESAANKDAADEEPADAVSTQAASTQTGSSSSGEESAPRAESLTPTLPPVEEEVREENAQTSDAQTGNDQTKDAHTAGRSDKPNERPSGGAEHTPPNESGSTTGGSADTAGGDKPVRLEPNQTMNQEGIIRERPTFYVRPDQMKAIRVSKAMRSSPLGRDLSDIAMALFDLFGFAYEADRAQNDNYGYPEEDVLDRLIPEDQWEEVLQQAKEKEGSTASRKALFYRVSRIIEDALADAGYGDGRKRRRK